MWVSSVTDGRSQPRGSRRRLGASLLAAVLAVGCGQAATPTGSPGPSPRPSTSGPSTSPAASVAIGPTPSPESYAPTIGGTVITVSDQLRVRSEPEVSASSKKYEPLLPLGTELRVLEGPVSRSGYIWYRVAPQSVELAGGVTDGWVAIASADGEPWIGDVAAATPSSEPSPSVAPAASPEPSATPPPSIDPMASLTPGPNLAPPPLDQVRTYFDVVWSGRQFVLAGTTFGDGYGDSDEIAFFASPDGVTWSMSDRRSAGVVTDYAFDRSGGGIAVGYFGTAAAVWASSDDMNWRRLPDQAALLPQNGESAVRLRQVARVASGYVAIGEAGPGALIVTSTDGQTWSRSTDRPATTLTTLLSLASSDDRVMLVGKIRNPFQTRMWTSLDGVSWSEVTLPAEFDPYWSGPWEVVEGPHGWLMRGGPNVGSRLWLSKDGTEWKSTAGPADVRIGGFYPGVSWGYLGQDDHGFSYDPPPGECTSGIWASEDANSWTCIPASPMYWSTLATSDELIVGINRSRPSSGPWSPVWVAPLDR